MNGAVEIATYMVTVDGSASRLAIRYNGDYESFIESIVRIIDGDWRGSPVYSLYGSAGDGVSHLVVVQRGNRDRWLGENRRVEGIYGAFLVVMFLESGEHERPPEPIHCSEQNLEDTIRTLEWVLRIARDEKGAQK
jgi:hypothetical protein